MVIFSSEFVQSSVVIVNYNFCKDVIKCISSFKENISDLSCEIIIVDNYSHDKSIENLIPKYSKAKFILLKGNLGFSYANNIGVSNTQSDYILFVNP